MLVMMRLMFGYLTLRGVAIRFTIPVTMPRIMYTISRRAKVFSQRLLTSFLLLPKLSKAPFCSTIIAGIISENIMEMIMPGMNKRNSPITVRIPVTS